MSLYLGNDLISGSKPINLGVRNVGEIVASSLPLTDAGLHLLDGTLINGSGIYKEFVDYIAELYYNSSGSSEIRTNPVMTSNNAPYGTVSSTGTFYSTVQPFSMLVGATTSTAWITDSGSVTYTYNVAQQPLAGTYKFYFQYGSYDTSGRSLNNVVITLTYEDNTISTINVGNLTGTIHAMDSYYITSEFTTSKKIKSFTLSHSGSSINTTTMNIGNFQLQRMVPNYFTDETTWQQSITDYGSCGKFVYNSTNNTVRLPKVSDILQGTTDLSVLGDLVVSGLPQHTHTRGTMEIYGYLGDVVSSTSSGANGAFNWWNTGAITSGFNNTTQPLMASDFYASRNWTGSTSNANYTSPTDTTSKVQPQTIKTLLYIVIATSSKTDVQVDIDEIATDLNGKVDTDLSNVSNTAGFRKLIELYNNGTSFYKVYEEYNPQDGSYVGKWCEQGGQISYPSPTWYSVSFLKPFVDTNYLVYGTYIASTSNFSNATLGIEKSSPSSCLITVYGIGFTADWYACGYIS